MYSITENFYTEASDFSLTTLSVNLQSKTYELKTGLSDDEVDMDLFDFVAPAILEIIVDGLNSRGFSKI